MDSIKNFLLVFLAVLSLILYRDLSSKQQDRNLFRDNLYMCENKLSQANSNIENAHYMTGGTYEEMFNALDNLETVN